MKRMLVGAVVALVCGVGRAETEWTWTAGRDLPVEGVGYADGETPFVRWPARAKGVVTPGLWGMGRQSTGVYLRFKTDADRLALRWTVENEHPTDPLIPEAGLSGLDVYRQEPGGRWRFVGNKRYWSRDNGTNVAGRAELAWTPGAAGLVYLPTRSHVVDLRVGVPKGMSFAAFPHPAGHEKPIVHYGTSIVHGGCASRPGLTFTAIAGRALDRNYINLGFSGAARMEIELPPLLAEIDAAVYVVDPVWNMNPSMIAERAAPFLRKLRELRPQTPILLCEGCTQAAKPMGTNLAMRKVYEALKREDPVKWSSLYYFNASGMFPPDDDELTHDFCHPNDWGSKFMGPAYAKRIQEVLDAHAAGTVAPSVDFGSVTGPVKPVNGVGQPPILSLDGTHLFRYLKEAGIPYSRLHDVGGAFGGGVFVDIPNLFRNFDADETKPENYDFFYTDLLLKALVANDVEPYFRLGVTIENAAGRGGKAYHAYPPKDYAKWARICEHVIRHYTEGWANGHRMKITHWEIWNEPENWDTIARNMLWKAPFDEYIKFYVIAAKHLKSKFPQLMIGGYGSCGFYGVSSSWADPSKDTRIPFLMKSFTDFLAGVKAAGAPLDFFSVHGYDRPVHIQRQMAYCRKTLDEYGFAKTRISLNEWIPCNGGPQKGETGGMRQAAEAGAVLCLAQNGVVDDAEVYDARARGGAYGPFFEPDTYRPRKMYYVFKAFNELRKLGTAVQVASSDPDLWLCAAKGADGRAAVLVVNTATTARTLPTILGGRVATRVRAVDEQNDLFEVIPDGTIPGFGVRLLEFK